MSTPIENLEIERLYNALEEGRITDAESDQFRDLLQTSAAAREEYIRLTEISVSLRNYAASQANVVTIISAKSKIVAFSLAAAAAIIIAFVFISQTQITPTTTKNFDFASIEWTEGDSYSGLKEGTRIGKGELEIGEDQQIGILLDGGTTMALAGPAKIDLRSATEAHLYEGRARIRINRKGQTFSLETDEFQVVDLGTEFGVWADPYGPDEAHVMEGSVEFSGVGKTRVLKAGQSVSGTGKAISYSPGLFYFGKDKHNAAPDQSDLSKLDAAKRKRDDRLVVYFPFLEETGDVLKNQSANPRATSNGVISGAQWTKGRLPGKPALLFTSKDSSVHFNIPGQFEAITLCAWVRIDALPNFYNAILTSDNFQPGAIHWQVEGTQGLNLGVSWEPGRWNGLYSKRPISSEPLGKWIHLATIFDTRSGKCVHYVNGTPIQSLFAEPTPGQRITPGKVALGNWIDPVAGDEHPVRHWTGAIDSFMFFGAALSPEEIAEMHRSSSAPPVGQ